MVDQIGRLWHWHPLVGVWIGVLGLLGVLVPLLRDLSKIGKVEKAVWTFVAFLLLLLEVKSVYQDRNEYDQQQAEARNEQLDQFRKIAKGIDKTITNSDRQFQTTLRTTNRVLLNVTGGTSIPYVVPQRPINGSVALGIHNDGTAILNGISLSIVRNTEQPCNGEWIQNATNLEVGTLFPGEPRILSLSITPRLQPTCFEPKEGPIDAYEITITAQNGMVIENLQLRASKERDIGEWAYRFWVTRETFKRENNRNVTYAKIVYQRMTWSDDQFREERKRESRVSHQAKGRN